MNKLIGLAVFAAALCVTSDAGAAPPASSSPALPADVLAELLLPVAQLAPEAVLVANCGTYDGTSCATPGSRLRCQWAPLEPGLCFCTVEHIWACG